MDLTGSARATLAKGAHHHSLKALKPNSITPTEMHVIYSESFTQSQMRAITA